MLLGVLLALAAGTIVIYIVTQASTGTGSTVTVVVAKEPIPEGKVLSVDTSDATHVRISDAFTEASVPQSLVPSNARPWVSQDDLNVYLNDQVVVGQFYQGDVLQASDPRLVKVGTGATGSLTLLNPGRIPQGSILFTINLQTGGQGNAKPIAVAGDYVDILATICATQSDQQVCEAQTVKQNLYVYSVTASQLVVVTDRKTAEELMLLKQTSNDMEVVLRGAGDNATPSPGNAINTGQMVKDFGF